MNAGPTLLTSRSARTFGFVLAILLGFSVLLSWLIREQYGFWQPDRAQLDWKGANWIGCKSGASDVAYLRRTFSLPQRPDYASLLVAGVDQFEVFVNGRRIGRQEYIGARPSAAFDLSRLLLAGLNVVAIQTKSSTRGSPGQAIARLEWNVAGAGHSLLSNDEWLCDSRERVGALGQTSWSEREYQATDWKRAIALDSNLTSERKLLRPALPARVVTEGPSGSWIWHHHRGTSVGGFERKIRIDDSYVKAAWLGISTPGQYFFAVNDIVVGPVSGSERRMDMLDIGPFLDPGENRVTIQVAGYSRPAKLAVTGFVESPRGVQYFSSGSPWRRTPNSEPVLVLESVSQQRPALTLMERVEIRNLGWRKLKQRLAVFVPVLAVVLALWPAFMFAYKSRGHASARANLHFCQPFALCAVALALVRLASWDPRVDIGPYTISYILLGVFVVVATWLSALVAHSRLMPPLSLHHPATPESA